MGHLGVDRQNLNQLKCKRFARILWCDIDCDFNIWAHRFRWTNQNQFGWCMFFGVDGTALSRDRSRLIGSCHVIIQTKSKSNQSVLWLMGNSLECDVQKFLFLTLSSQHSFDFALKGGGLNNWGIFWGKLYYFGIYTTTWEISAIWLA